MLNNAKIEKTVSEHFEKLYTPSQIVLILDKTGTRLIGGSSNSSYMIQRITGKESFSATKENLVYMMFKLEKFGYEVVISPVDTEKLK